MLKYRPTLPDLYAVIDTVDSYPVSVQEVIEVARDRGAGQEVIDFYETFPADESFSDKDDLAARTEQVHILDESEEGQPREIYTASEED